MNTCTIEIGGNEYTLCLTRESIKEMEKQGFNIQDFMAKPITYMDILWVGGFYANHRNINKTKALNLQDEYKKEGGDVNEVIEFLVNEYANFVNAPADTKSVKKAKIVKA